MSITWATLCKLQSEYIALLKVENPSARILDRLGYLEQYFDMIELGEISVEDKEHVNA
mgnify:CR=1 FL=1